MDQQSQQREANISARREYLTQTLMSMNDPVIEPLLELNRKIAMQITQGSMKVNETPRYIDFITEAQQAEQKQKLQSDLKQFRLKNSDVMPKQSY